MHCISSLHFEKSSNIKLIGHNIYSLGKFNVNCNLLVCFIVTSWLYTEKILFPLLFNQWKTLYQRNPQTVSKPIIPAESYLHSAITVSITVQFKEFVQQGLIARGSLQSHHIISLISCNLVLVLMWKNQWFVNTTCGPVHTLVVLTLNRDL